MKILLNEEKFSALLNEFINEYSVNTEPNSSYTKKIETDKNSLEKLLKIDGSVMTNIKNGKDYIVYELYSLANVLGKRYCICQLLKDGEQYGQVATKPLSMFKPKNY
ncbi:MAG: hypothetical protein IKT40_04615 [Bacilli bacterium]|nr:hypothetical protein [Bacilli bacterium]